MSQENEIEAKNLTTPTTDFLPSDGTSCSQVLECELTVAQVESTHCFGECWIKDYDRNKREYWEKALWLWAWDRKVIWQQNRMLVPVGLNPANSVFSDGEKGLSK